MGSTRLGPRNAGDLEGPFDGAGFQDAGGTVAHRSGLATNCGIGFLLLSGPAAPRSAAVARRPGHRNAPRAAPSPPARNAPAACARTCCRACCCGPAAAGRRSTARATSGPARPQSRACPGRPAVAARRHDRRGRLRAAAGHLQQPPARRPFHVVLPDPPLQLLPSVPPFRGQVAPPRRQPVLRFLQDLWQPFRQLELALRSHASAGAPAAGGPTAGTPRHRPRRPSSRSCRA